MSEKNYMTPSGYQRLKDEFTQLMQIDRPKVVEVVAWAASNGDRSENADYQYGKRKLREIDNRIHVLTKKLENAEVVDPKVISSQKIVFGATVTVIDETENSFTYQIVGEDELDPKNGKISWKSPVAKALLGKQVGDEALVTKPSKVESYIIEKVEYI